MSNWKNRNLIDKTKYSLNGLKAAFASEKAVRQETAVLLTTTVFAFFKGLPAGDILCVFLACLVPIVAELINTAAETIIDLQLGATYREDVRIAKDMLSAAVLLCLAIGYGISFKILFLG